MSFPNPKLTMYSRTMLGICTAWALLIVGEIVLVGTDTGPAPESGTEVTTTGQGAATIKALQIPPVIAYREVTERPLFLESRRPPVAAQDGPSARAVQLASAWKLTGIVMAGDDSFVHVQAVRDRATRRLQLGAVLDGWRVDEITSNNVVFASGDERQTLWLLEDE